MAYKSKDLYKAGKRHRWITIPLFIIAAVLVAAIALFYIFRQFVVYDQNGIRLELPFLSSDSGVTDASEQGAASGVVADIIYEDPDFESLEATAGEGLTELRALYVPAEGINEESINSYVAALNSRGANALILQLKPAGGQLAWKSAVYEAEAYGASGEYDISSLVQSLKDREIYLVAELSCFADELMATRNTPLAITDFFGEVYSDSAGTWLDPYNHNVRNYIISLMDELAGLGFDEILLTNLSHPAIGDDTIINYSQPLSSQPDPVTVICNCALKFTDAMESSHVRVSAKVNLSALSGGVSEKTGQDLSVFTRVFDRIYSDSSAGSREGDAAVVSDYITVGDVSNRFAPIMSAEADSGSWVLK